MSRRGLDNYEVDGETGCWIWQGATSPRGYGRVSISGRIMLAHRAMYEREVGVIPDGMQLDHLCRNPSCVNPEHLEPVTHLENVRRGVVGEVNSARFAAMTHCKNGHPRTPDNVRVRSRLSARGTTVVTRACRICERENLRRHRAKAKRST